MPVLPTTLQSRWTAGNCSPCCGFGCTVNEKKMGMASTTTALRTPPEKNRREPREVKPAGEDKVSILLVDDRDDKRLSMEAIIEELGQNIVKASSGREALRCLLDQDFALILLDVNMPGMDGFETAHLI